MSRNKAKDSRASQTQLQCVIQKLDSPHPWVAIQGQICNSQTYSRQAIQLRTGLDYNSEPTCPTEINASYLWAQAQTTMLLLGLSFSENSI